MNQITAESLQDSSSKHIDRVYKAYMRGRFGYLHYRATKPCHSAEHSALVCLHAAPFSGRSFNALLSRMATSRWLIAPDIPGYGDSDAPANEPEITDYAAAIGELLDSLGLNRVNLFGHDLGSAVAVELARQRPLQVRRLVLVSVPDPAAEKPLAGEQGASKLDGKLDGKLDLLENGDHAVQCWRELRSQCLEDWNLASQFGDALRRPTLSGWGGAAMHRYAFTESLAQLDQAFVVLDPPGWKLGFLDVHTDALAEMLCQRLDEELQ